MLWLLGCAPPVPSTSPITPTNVASDSGLFDSGDTGQLEPPDATTGVLIIGSGPAGLSAAMAASEAGAEVLVLEREDIAGGAGWYGGGFFAAGTPWQADAGHTDTPADALAEWADFTGGDGTDARVVQFVEGSAEIVDWLAGLGAQVDLNPLDPAAGSVPRIHAISHKGAAPVGLLVALLSEEIRLSVAATGLVTDHSGAVIGASYASTDGSDVGWIAADAVVVATGGMARDVARIVADRPGLETAGFVAEAAHSTDAGGHDLLEEVGAVMGNAGKQGVYVHAVPDYRDPSGSEALWPTTIAQGILVDSAGERRYDESFSNNFELIDWLLEDPQQTLWLVVRDMRFRGMEVLIPAYNWETLGAPETLGGPEVADALKLATHGSPAELAEVEGIDVDGLTATIAAYDAGAKTGEDVLGKDPGLIEPLGDVPLLAVPLVPGAAKSFGGVLLAPDGGVLGADGSAIPGLFAAGEVAGMLGTEAIGRGFSGTVGACYFTGWVAGEAAAARSR